MGKKQIVIAIVSEFFELLPKHQQTIDLIFKLTLLLAVPVKLTMK
jgi:hypothetical protein